MKNKYILLPGIILLLIMTSCLKSLLCIRGDGIIEVETRRVTSFNQIENSTSFDIIYRNADTLGISISAEQNILDYIETNVYDNCLEIRTSPGSICLDYTERPVITVTSPSLKKVINSGSGEFLAGRMSGETVYIKLSGSGDISVENIIGNNIDLTLSGSGDIEIKESSCSNSDCLLSGSGNISINGDCEDAHLKITGSGNIYSSDFVTNSASIIISGSGSAFTTIEEYLNGLISGSGNIYVSGNPDIVQTVTGSGRIIKRK
jgi:hypothetical protein